MRLSSPIIPVPYFTLDGDGRMCRTHSTFRFSGNVDRRRVRRMIRSSFRRVGLHMPKDYIDAYIRLAYYSWE